MGKSREIRIDTQTFKKAEDGTTFFRAMLGRYKVGDEVGVPDALHLTALLKRHDEMTQKIGVGIDHFEVDAAPEPFPGKCFWIVRTDGSRDDFSFPHCLKRKPYD